MIAIDVDDVLDIRRLVTTEGAADIKIEKCYKRFSLTYPRISEVYFLPVSDV